MDDTEFNIKKADNGFSYGSTKTYNHSIGLSSAFRQWRAESHCKLIHGYSLKIHFEFRSKELDHRNWAVDFGSLKSLKGWLEDLFDHKLLVAEDDPKISIFKEMQIAGLCELRVLPAVGCEAFARFIFEYTEQWLKDNGYNHVYLERVHVHEHESNSSSYGRN